MVGKGGLLQWWVREGSLQWWVREGSLQWCVRVSCCSGG